MQIAYRFEKNHFISVANDEAVVALSSEFSSTIRNFIIAAELPDRRIVFRCSSTIVLFRFTHKQETSNNNVFVNCQ